MNLRLAAVVLAGCGRIGFAPSADAGRDSQQMLGPFGLASPITELNRAFTDDPTLSSDELEIVFHSNRSGGVGDCDLWTSTRASIGAPWAPPNNLTAVNTTACDGSPLITGGDLVLRFATNGSAANLDLFDARRAAQGMPWQPPLAITELNTITEDEFAPTSTADDLMMVYGVFAGLGDLLVATRPNTQQPWSGRALITELAIGVERSGHLSGDGLTLWFVSDRPGGGGGGHDLWAATRVSRSALFDPPVPLTELNTSDDEDDPWVSEDRRRIYFARKPLTGSPQLFEASR